jgi:hypothetical protein
MNAATPIAQHSVEVGEWLWFYPQSRINNTPARALATADANHMDVVTMTVFFQGGPRPMPSVMKHGDKRFDGNRDLQRNGCWSRDRLDKS